MRAGLQRWHNWLGRLPEKSTNAEVPPRRSRDADGCVLFSVPSTHLLSGLDVETGEITFGAWSDPEGHTARGIAEFEIIHNQTGLAGAIDIQVGLRPFDRDAVAGPDARLEVHVTLVLFWCLLADDNHPRNASRLTSRSRRTLPMPIAPGIASGSAWRFRRYFSSVRWFGFAGSLLPVMIGYQ